MLKDTDIRSLSMNPFTMIGEEWMLLAAGDETESNAMTVSWGHLGSIWDNNSPTAVVYLRPQRYTKKFMDGCDRFSLSVFPEGYRDALSYMGSHSGRDGDKFAATGLRRTYSDGTVYFTDARAVLICEKVYSAPIKPEGFADRGIIERNYPKKDFHTMYIGKIVRVLTQ